MLNRMLDDGVTVVTNSWSSCEDQTTVAALQAIDSVVAQAAAGGVPVFNDMATTVTTARPICPSSTTTPPTLPTHPTASASAEQICR